MKDLTFDVDTSSLYTSTMRVLYGGKKIIAVTVRKDDVTEIKAVLFALQAEMQKDVIAILQKKLDTPILRDSIGER